jgi:preprotein translocase subunit SecB
MVEVKNAAFKFKRFKIPTFSYNEAGKPKSTIRLDFVPSGRYFQEKGLFELKLELFGCDDSSKEKKIVYLNCIAEFEFEKDLPFTDIPSYFYKNAIAIVFPYIRSFISTLTLQANSGLIILGLMNLSNLEAPLIKNTISE